MRVRLAPVIRRAGLGFSAAVERWMPGPFIFALSLSYLVFIAGIGIMGRTPIEMLQFWNDGFWDLLGFGMQMVLILATGFVLGYHPSVQRVIGRLASIPSTGREAVLLVGLVSMATAWVHWGLGLVVGAVFAREMGRQSSERGIPVHYPLLCVAGYMGLGLTWHWGLSASAPLIMNTPHNVFIGLGLVDGVVPPSATIFHPYALALLVASAIYGLAVLYLLAPSDDDAAEITRFVPELRQSSTRPAADGGATERDAGPDTVVTPADRIEESRVIGGLVAIGGVLMTGYLFATEGAGALSFNVINFGLLFIGLALYTRPNAYQEEFYNAVSSTAGIILQFPFYAGIMGMMIQSGLSRSLAETMLATSTETTFPAVVWISSAVLNLFVPSGGAEWTVVGDSVLSVAQTLDVPPGQAIIAFGTGDAVGNLFQPFWAIPLIGIVGLRARAFFGYAILVLLFLVPFLTILHVLLPY